MPISVKGNIADAAGSHWRTVVVANHKRELNRIYYLPLSREAIEPCACKSVILCHKEVRAVKFQAVIKVVKIWQINSAECVAAHGHSDNIAEVVVAQKERVANARDAPDEIPRI
jgi:hypothetical protein